MYRKFFAIIATWSSLIMALILNLKNSTRKNLQIYNIGNGYVAI